MRRAPGLRNSAELMIVLLLTVGASAFASEAPLDAYEIARRYTPPEPLSPWAGIDDEVERLVVRGELPLEALSFRPIDRGELAAWLQASRAKSGVGVTPARRRAEQLVCEESARWLSPPGRHNLEQAKHPAKWTLHERNDELLWVGPYVRLAPIFREGRETVWTGSSRVGFRAGYSVGNWFALSAGMFAAEVADGRGFADPLVAGTDLILHEEELTVSVRGGPFRLRLGRDRHRWGPGLSGTLLFSDTAEPFNFAEYQVRIGSRLRALAVFGMTDLHRNRYLAAHRLTWTPRDNVSLSLTEGARFQSNAPHLLYAAGFVPYTLVERFDLQTSLGDSTAMEQRNNVLWALEALWRPAANVLLYGELLADDIATESAEQPTRGGMQCGATIAPRWHGWDWTLGGEYTRVSNYTYSVYYQDLCLCDWEHQGEPVGYGWGPDSEVLLLRIGADVTEAWGGRAWMRQVRRGEGRVGIPWAPTSTGCCTCSDPNCGDVNAWSFAGTVEETRAFGFRLLHQPSRLVQLALWAELAHIRHPRHDPLAAAETNTRGGLVLSVGYR